MYSEIVLPLIPAAFSIMSFISGLVLISILLDLACTINFSFEYIIYNNTETIFAKSTFSYQDVNTTRVLIEFNNISKVYNLNALNYTISNDLIRLSQKIKNPGIGEYKLTIKIQNNNFFYEETKNIKIIKNIGYDLEDNKDIKTTNNDTISNDTINKNIISESRLTATCSVPRLTQNVKINEG